MSNDLIAVPLVCKDCDHKFGVKIPAYISWKSVAYCPKCGSEDINLYVPDDLSEVRDDN